jgi:hypothetical protein
VTWAGFTVLAATMIFQPIPQRLARWSRPLQRMATHPYDTQALSSLAALAILEEEVRPVHGPAAVIGTVTQPAVAAQSLTQLAEQLIKAADISVSHEAFHLSKAAANRRQSSPLCSSSVSERPP